jgi:hypothetical protein
MCKELEKNKIVSQREHIYPITLSFFYILCKYQVCIMLSWRPALRNLSQICIILNEFDMWKILMLCWPEMLDQEL